MTIPEKGFYLGRIYDAELAQTGEEPLAYAPDDLTTHAVIVGMTGSGKTGLCLNLMEEAALRQVPALMLDPKGDITNAVLHFPELRPQDFQPWINLTEAQRDGKTAEQAAADTAALWQRGLEGWEIGRERIQALKDSAQFAIYTPGSDAGLPVSILASLDVPEIPWAGNEEVLRERISGTVTALLGLVGMTNIDPVRSREHILLSNIFERAWSAGKGLSLGELIMQTQSPPFDKLGVFDINIFFPEKDRFDLAISLNNILAAPAFQSWIVGEPLNVQRLMYTADGRPRHTIFYLAHLNEAERMFFVTLLFGAVETWMRAQSGTGSLRALLYFDEIFGYLPPTANPPSKEPMLRMLKQARAFGVGLVLATQNPVDVDYKALSNAGSWFIGKLATEQDKNRLLDGLESAMSGVGLDRRTYDKLISSLGKRVFLLRNVHEKEPALFQTRWAMNYLAGPMTRTQIPGLNALANATAAPAQPAAQAAPAVAPQTAAPAQPAQTAEALPGTETRPSVPSRVAEYFLPNNLTLSQAAAAAGEKLAADAAALAILYRPVLLAQSQIRVQNRKYGVDVTLGDTAIVPEPDERGSIRWEGWLEEGGPVDERRLDRAPVPRGRFASLDAPLNDASLLAALQRDFADWAYRKAEIKVQANEQLGIYAGPDVSAEDFKQMCLEAAKQKALEESSKVSDKFDRQIASVTKKLRNEERELTEDEEELTQRKREEGVKHVETVFSWIGLGGGRRRSLSGSMSKRRMTAKAKADVEESIETIEELKKELEELEAAKKEELDELSDRWLDVADETTEIPVQPFKKDVGIELFGVAWFPYHVVRTDGRVTELAGFRLENKQ